MLTQLLAGIACLVAVVLQLAVFRCPDIVDTPLQKMARRIMMVALAVGGLYALGACWNKEPSNGPLLLALIGAAMSQSLYAFSNLLPHLEKEHHRWTSRLNSSP